mgnify:CR=1 FL=1
MNPAKSLILWAFIAFGTWMMLASVGQRASMQAWQQIDYSKFLTEQGDRQRGLVRADHGHREALHDHGRAAHHR